MINRAQQVRNFFFGQHVADGFRRTLAIFLPALAGAYFGHLDKGTTIALGALCVSISDAPGPLKLKRNGMLFCLLFVTVMALATGLLNHHDFWMGILIAAATFFFSMLNIYGSRAASVGTAALLVMVLRMSDLLPPVNVLSDTFYIFSGGAWYLLTAIAFSVIRPFRPIQRALGDCIVETANYLHIKADFYDLSKDVNVSYDTLLKKQSDVNESQNLVRDLLFKNRSVLKESTFQGRLLVFTFVATVDLYEQIMATWYDYNEIREKYKDTSVLQKISTLLKKIADELSTIGLAIHSQNKYISTLDVVGELDKIKKETEAGMGKPLDFTLRRIFINIRDVKESINRISRYFNVQKSDLSVNVKRKDFVLFASHQKISGAMFLDSFELQSSAFRHALRVMITCLTGYVLAQTFFTGNHSYWILMTIIIILKPAYTLTKEKNIDRLSGTIVGAILGLLLLYFIKNENVLFILIVFFALGAYTFIRINYAVSVIFMTPYVLILFHFLGENIANVAGERLLDTILAGALSFLATRFLFPSWESHDIDNALMRVLTANISYLQHLEEIILTRKSSPLGYRLARKEVFVSTANLAASLHRMQGEPESKQKNRKEFYELVVLNHVLSSNVASLADTINKNSGEATQKLRERLNKSIQNLVHAVQMTNPEYKFIPAHLNKIHSSKGKLKNPDLEDQLNFIRKITGDIKRIREKMNPATQ